MKIIRIGQRGFFGGEFTITTEDRTFSIGNYVEVCLTESPRLTGETYKDFRGRERHIITFPLIVTECCHIDDIEVTLREVVGSTSYKQWFDCLTIGETSVVTPVKHQFRSRTWYTPKIDGWVVGMFGRTKDAPLGGKNV